MDSPVGVEIVGSLLSDDQVDGRGARFDTVTPLAEGAFVVLAELYLPETLALDVADRCLAETTHIVKATWSGGVSGATGSTSTKATGSAPASPIPEVPAIHTLPLCASRTGDRTMSPITNQRPTPHRALRPALVPAAITIFGLAGLGAAGTPDLNGTWTYAGGPVEERARLAAIDKVTASMRGFMKGKARGKLKERTAPPKTVRIQIEASNLTLRGQGGKTLSLEMGAAPIEIEGPNGRAKVSAKAIPDGFVVVDQSDKGDRTTTYRLAQEALLVSVRMTGDRLDGPLDYRMSFRRN